MSYTVSEAVIILMNISFNIIIVKGPICNHRQTQRLPLVRLGAPDCDYVKEIKYDHSDSAPLWLGIYH